MEGPQTVLNCSLPRFGGAFFFAACSVLHRHSRSHLLAWISDAAEEILMLTSAECRARAEQNFAEADLQPRHKRRLRSAAEGWLILADLMERLEASVSGS